MGVNVGMSMGWGIFVPQEAVDKWASTLYLEEGSIVNEALDDYMLFFPGVTCRFVGDTRAGVSEGWIFYSTYDITDWDARHESVYGAFTPPAGRYPPQDRRKTLRAAAYGITGQVQEIEWIVSGRVA